MNVRHIFISSGHNYFGHYGRPQDDYPLLEVPRIDCVAGRGIRGDRFFDFRENYKGQITFFSAEVFEELVEKFQLPDKSPGVLRRNVIVAGVDLKELIGTKFQIQGVQFLGTGHCKPCYWLDTAFALGTEQFLQHDGGLRAEILTDGTIEVGEAHLVLLSGQAELIA